MKKDTLPILTPKLLASGRVVLLTSLKRGDYFVGGHDINSVTPESRAAQFIKLGESRCQAGEGTTIHSYGTSNAENCFVIKLKP